MTPAEKNALRERIADVLVDVEPWFDRRCKLTFVMRAPHLADGDLVVTADAIQDVIAALQRLNMYEPVKDPSLQAVVRVPTGTPEQP
jgi:hypothetical protein